MEIQQLVKEAPELDFGNELSQIFIKQSEISYISSVYDPRVNRKTMLSFLGNISKAYGLYMGILMAKANPELYDGYDKNKYLYNFNFEIATSLANLIDFVSSVNIGEADINNYYENLLTQLKLDEGFYFPNATLKTCMAYARLQNIRDQVYNNPEVNLRPVVRYNGKDDNFIKAGRIIDEVYANILQLNCWAISHNSILSNLMIPKSIEQSFDQYQNQLMAIWIFYFKLLDLLGHDDDSVGRIYSVYYYSQLYKSEKKK
jgi:hypothetical protein